MLLFLVLVLLLLVLVVVLVVGVATGELSEMGTARAETLTCWHEQVIHAPGGGETHRVSELLRWMDEATVIVAYVQRQSV